MLLFDSHVHSHHSHDSRQTMEEIFAAARERGLAGVAITDHADTWYLEKDHTFEHIAASVMEAELADGLFEGEVRFFAGIEVSDHADSPSGVRKLLDLAEYDVVLGSVHCVLFEDWDDAYSRLNFEASVPEEKIQAFLKVYFDKLLTMAQTQDYDVLTHLTCPLRYINGKYQRGISAEPHGDVIEKILHTVIERDKALEVNTSGIGKAYIGIMPDEAILRRYYDMGGRMITLGSDGHAPEKIGNGFNEAVELLKQIGFAGHTYFEKRKPVFVPFDI